MKKLATWFCTRYSSIKDNRQKRFVQELNDSVGFKIKNGKFLLICRGIIMKEYPDNTQIKDVVAEINTIIELNTKYTNVY